MKYLLDTNVYLEAFRSDEKKSQFRQIFFPLLPVTFLASVVAYELNVNAKNRHTRALLQEFIGPMGRTGRFVSPTFGDWVEAWLRPVGLHHLSKTVLGIIDRAADFQLWLSKSTRSRVASLVGFTLGKPLILQRDWNCTIAAWCLQPDTTSRGSCLLAKCVPAGTLLDG